MMPLYDSSASLSQRGRMKLLLSLCTSFQLLLSSSSSFCGVPLLSSDWTEHVHIQTTEHNDKLVAPWLVNILGNGKRCQGIILSNWWVLTAANCFLLMKPSHVELTGTHGRHSTITITQFVVHRGFSSWDAVPNNDLALVLLAQPIDLRRQDMWPVCVPHRQESPDILVQCNIFERGQSGSKRWLMNRIMVHILVTSQCATRWPDTTEQWNLCVARKISKHRDCTVPIGSPVICRDPAREHWEVVGIVSQSLQNCTAPVLATQVVPHLHWLWKEGAVVNPFQRRLAKTASGKSSFPRTEGVSSTARQPATFPEETSFRTSKQTPLREHAATIQSPLKSLQVPVILPDTEQPSSMSVKTQSPPLVITKTTEYTTTEARKPPISEGHSTLVNPSKISQTSPHGNQIIFVAFPTIHQSVHVTSTTKQHLPQTTKPVHVIIYASTASQAPSVVSSTPKSLQGISVTHTTSPPTSVTHTTSPPTSATHTTTSPPTSATHTTTSPPTSATHTTSPPTSATHTTTSPPTSATHTTTSSPAAPTTRPSPHVVIIPATTTSPDSTMVPPKTSPQPSTDVNQGKSVTFIAVGSHYHKSKRDIAPFPDLSVTLLAPLTTATPRTSSLESPVQVTVEQCEMGLAWNSSSRTYQLNKIAIPMDHRVGCGLRPVFVPKCPNCSEAEVGEFPWIVSLRLSTQHICAGSILNPGWILTTANCANLIKNSEALALVQAGLASVSEEMHSVPIRQALTHPHWLVNQDLHNVGLLQLEKPLDLGPLIAPICLSDKANMIGDFRDCWLPGWTVLEGGLAILLRHPLDILNISNCNPLGEQLSSAIFCMKAQRSQEGACKGDVGSPLICRDPQSGAWLQLGVLSSFDEACSRPYVFSSLPRYLPWLESTTKVAGHHDNLTLPWEWQDPTKHLRVLQEPETLVKQISAYFSLPWQVLVATCGNRSCVGSILDRYWVLTTAQCVQEVDPANTAVFVGLTYPSGQIQGIRVARIYPHEGNLQYSLSGGYTMALLLLQKPISFDQHVTSMTFSQMESWDTCKVMGLQLLQSDEKVETDPSAYQAKVLAPSECAKELPGVSPTVYCIVRNTASHKPLAATAAVGEGAALLCRLEAKSTTWSQVGLTSKPFPGSHPIVLSSSIASYVDWMEETSKQAKHVLFLTSGRAAYRPSSWVLLLLLLLFGGTELG